jgi:hypothetical protein
MPARNRLERDPWNTPGAAAWLAHVKHQVLPMIKDSGIYTVLMPEEPDIKVAVELGLMMYYDKPIIIIIVPPGRKVPAKLRLVADHVVEADVTTPEGRKAMQAVLGRYVHDD